MNRVWTLAAALAVTASLAVTLAFQSHANQVTVERPVRPVMLLDPQGFSIYVCTNNYIYKIDKETMRVKASGRLEPIYPPGWVGGGGPAPGK